jgi:hypothetical protein
MESNQLVKIKDILESKAFVAIAVSTAINFSFGAYCL